MCGIAGFAGGFVPGLVERMNAAQKHRGPDGEGVFADPEAGAALGHVRLAILDLSDAAAQPMRSPSGRYVLSYNGEIYNYRELRDELEGRGVTFRSSGDTEVLAAGLDAWGVAFAERLNGIFAFALWDRGERVLHLVRDPLGVKPLYYAEPRPGTLLFASELKALCAHPDLRREADPAVLLEHLAFCHACGEATALAGTRRLLPGRVLTWRDGTFTVRRFWRAPFAVTGEDGDREAAVSELRGALVGATRRQLVSDVPVGFFLSGGLDSSLLVAAAAGQAERLRAYTITYPDEDNVLDRFVPDAPYARRVARELGVELVEVELRPEVASLWPRLVHHLDEPVADPAAIASYLIARLAKDDGTPVLLSGQGADELFGGYPRYRAVQATAWLDAVPRGPRRLLARTAGLLPGARPGAVGGALRRLRRVAERIDRGTDERFLAWCASTPEEEIEAVLHPDFRDALGRRRAFDSCLAHMSERGLPGLARFLERDLSVYLASHNLLYTDKMGMAAGVEARVPLVDQELVERVTRYPASWKLGGGRTKILLREAARGLVPDEVVERPKAGFGAPYRKWLRSDLGELWQDLTSESAVRSRGWFDPRALADARRRSQAGRTDLYMLQWAVLTVELWARSFLDRNPAGESYDFPAPSSAQTEPEPSIRDPGRSPSSRRSPGAGGAEIRLPGRSERFDPDDRLARPEYGQFGEEVIDGVRMECMPSDPEHADPQQRLGTVVGVCLNKGYVASTELLTRRDKESDFATDVCVRKEGVDPETGGRYVEEISFEVANSQTREDLEKVRVPKLLACGVRRIFAVLVPEGDVLEWSVEDGDWRGWASGEEIRDPVFVQPLAVKAILDAAEVDPLVSKAQLTKKEPHLMGEIKKREAKVLAELEKTN